MGQAARSPPYPKPATCPCAYACPPQLVPNPPCCLPPTICSPLLLVPPQAVVVALALAQPGQAGEEVAAPGPARSGAEFFPASLFPTIFTAPLYSFCYVPPSLPHESPQTRAGGDSAPALEPEPQQPPTLGWYSKTRLSSPY